MRKLERPEELGTGRVAPVPAPLQAKIVKRSSDWHHFSFRRMHFDPQYPGLVFTEHGPRCVDLDVEAITEGAKDDESNNKDGEEALETVGPWLLPHVGVYDRSIMWIDYVIKLPESFRVSEKPFARRVQGRMVVVGGNKRQLLLLRFKDVPIPSYVAPRTRSLASMGCSQGHLLLQLALVNNHYVM